MYPIDTQIVPHYENIFFEEMLILRHTLPNFDICEDRGQFFPLIMIQWFSPKCDRPVIYHKDKIVKRGYAMLIHPKAFRPDLLLTTTRDHLDGGTIFGILLCVTNLAILLLLKLNHRAEP